MMTIQKALLKLSVSALALHMVTACDNKVFTPEISKDVDTETLEQNPGKGGTNPTDARSGMDVVMPEAAYKAVTFKKGEAELTEDSKVAMKEFANELIEIDKPVYLTVRAVDGDGVEATEPEKPFAPLVSKRFQVLNEIMTNDGVTIAMSRLDKTGVVADYGEDSALARPESEMPSDEYQIVIVKFRSTPEVVHEP